MLKQLMKMQGLDFDKGSVVPPFEIKKSTEGTWEISHLLDREMNKQILDDEVKCVEMQPSPEIAFLHQQRR